MNWFKRNEQLDRLERAVGRLETAFETLLNQSELITMADLANLTNSIDQQGALIASVKASVDVLQAKLNAALATGTDQATIDALQATIDANNAAIAAIVPA